MTPQDFWFALREWSEATFGLDIHRKATGPLKHLQKEVADALATDAWDTRAMEIVDCLFLTFDAARRHGMTFDMLFSLAQYKLEINKRRTWPKSENPDEPIEHERK